MMKNNLITVSQAAKILYGSPKKFYRVHRLIYKKRFSSSQKIGWIWVIDRSEVMKIKKKLKSKKNSR